MDWPLCKLLQQPESKRTPESDLFIRVLWRLLEYGRPLVQNSQLLAEITQSPENPEGSSCSRRGCFCAASSLSYP